MLFGKRYYLRLSKSFHLDKFEILSAAYSVADFFIQSRSRFRIKLAGKRIILNISRKSYACAYNDVVLFACAGSTTVSPAPISTRMLAVTPVSVVLSVQPSVSYRPRGRAAVI